MDGSISRGKVWLTAPFLLLKLGQLTTRYIATERALLLILVHRYRHLRGAYRVGRLGAAWRTIWLQLSADFVLALFALGLAASGIAE